MHNAIIWGKHNMAKMHRRENYPELPLRETEAILEGPVRNATLDSLFLFRPDVSKRPFSSSSFFKTNSESEFARVRGLKSHSIRNKRLVSSATSLHNSFE